MRLDVKLVPPFFVSLNSSNAEAPPIEVYSVPAKSNTSQCNVPSKYPSLNSRLDEPISTSLSVTGSNTQSLSNICAVPFIVSPI